MLERTFAGQIDVDAQNVNVGGNVITVSGGTFDTGWSQIPGGSLQYAGEPDRIEITAMVVNDAQATNQRMAPGVNLEKSNNGGPFALVPAARSRTGYIRLLNGHQTSSNHVSWTDMNPGLNPTYRLVAVQAGVGGNVQSVGGHFTGIATERETVTVYVPPSGATSSGVPAGNDVVNNFASDQFNFQLQVQNVTAGTLDVETIWNNRPYSTIPSLVLPTGWSHSVVPDGALFDHVFTGPAPSFQNITISGGQTVPAGDADNSQIENYIV